MGSWIGKRIKSQKLSWKIKKQGKHYWRATYKGINSAEYVKISPQRAYAKVKGRLHKPKRDNSDINIKLFNELARSLGMPEEKNWRQQHENLRSNRDY